ncbi:MauE/DoxX family redox-associated membrane protein [Streptomyces sp. NPDC090022]|uniref:MauE/DoxX family redox-associated membrane protein n=1 Tax=Streptomyces sp. NPDC090022 TaxID=3365920 RepID=UPI00382512CC
MDAATAWETTAWGSRGCLLLVFALSVHGKVRSRRAFEEFTDSVRTLAPAFAGRARPAAALVVAAEAVAATALAVPGSGALGLALGAVLLAAFTVVVAAALRAGTGAACRCFGRSSTPLSRVHLVRNAVLFAVAGYGLAATVLAGPGTGAPAAAVVPALGAGAVLGLPAAVLDDLVGLFRPLS